MGYCVSAFVSTTIFCLTRSGEVGAGITTPKTPMTCVGSPSDLSAEVIPTTRVLCTYTKIVFCPRFGSSGADPERLDIYPLNGRRTSG